MTNSFESRRTARTKHGLQFENIAAREQTIIYNQKTRPAAKSTNALESEGMSHRENKQ